MTVAFQSARKRIATRLGFALICCLIALMLVESLTQAGRAQVSTPVLIDVSPIGVAYVTVTGTLLISETVQCVGEPLYVYEVRPAELLVYLDVDTRSLLLFSPTDEYLDYVIVYVTLFSRPLGDNVWLAEVIIPYESLIVLPPNASIRSIEPPPLGIEMVEERVALRVGAGSLKLTYTVPTEPSFPLPPTTPSPSPTSSPVTPTAPPAFPGGVPLVALTTLIAVAVAVAVAVALLRGGRGRRGEKEVPKGVEAFLDERDKAIVDYLRSKGPSSPSDIMKATGIPRSAFYRRIERLVRLGIVESIDLGGRRVYRLKEGVEGAEG